MVVRRDCDRYAVGYAFYAFSAFKCDVIFVNRRVTALTAGLRHHCSSVAPLLL